MQEKNTPYDLIITGGGGAGLSLAYQLSLEKALSDLSVLLIDKQDKNKNDRTWCFWATQPPPPVADLVSAKWQKFGFSSPKFSRDFDIEPYAYYQIRGIDFYRKVSETLEKTNNITRLKANVEEVVEKGEAVHVKANGRWYEGKYAFDSRIDEAWLRDLSKDRVLLLQHFKGWMIETEKPVFEAQKAQFFDFNLPQRNEVRFVYILPQSERKALVEFTVFSKQLLTDDTYDSGLKDYLEKHYGQMAYEICEVEKGIIPMTDAVFRKVSGKRIINIGTRGGMCKGSSGFTFLHMQRDSQQIVGNLVNGRHPNHGRKGKGRFWLFDATILRVMHQDGGSIAAVFADMFRKNPIHRTLRFLDEKSTFPEDLKIMWSVPSWRFTKAFFGVLLREITILLKKPTR